MIGANPAGMTNSSQHFREVPAKLLAHGPTVESADTNAALAALIARMDSGGMVLIAQDIYPNLTTEMADLVLPAAAWGEMNGVRINGERRARLYEQFMDPPGQAMRDWWIIAQIAQRMSFSGFDWKTDEDVFTELAPNAQYDASGIVQYAASVGKSPYTVLRGLQSGIQLPAKFLNGQLVGTTRLFEDRKFGTTSGKAMFINFESFVNPEITTKFWFTKSSGRLEAGKQVTWTWEMYNISTQVTVKEVEKNKRILIEWPYNGSPTTVEWIFTPHKNDSTFVSVTNTGFQGDGDEIVAQALDSTGGFTWVLAGLKAYLEHNIMLNLIADRFPKGLREL